MGLSSVAHSQSLYYVSYCVLNGDAGANPFGHSCLIFSKRDDSGRIQVEKVYGYYSQASTTTQPILKWLKLILGIKYDLQGTHAVLREEKMRELIGDGLKGLSFAISETSYQAFLNTMANKLRIQEEQMAALDEELTSQNMKPSGSLRYGLQLSKTDLAAERRLPPFHIQTTWTLNTSGSTTCKQLALDLLGHQQILTRDQRQELECPAGFRQAFPRFADRELAPIRLHATGAYIKQTSRSGKVFFNPTQENGNQLFWILPPNLPKYADEIKGMRALDAKLQPIMQTYRELLRQLYPLNSTEAQAVIHKLHEYAEQLTWQNEATEEKLNQLQRLMDYAKGQVHPHYYQSNYVSRFFANKPLITMAILSLALTGLTTGLLILGAMNPSLALAMGLIWTLDLVALTTAYMKFNRSEAQWQRARTNASSVLAQLQNPLPGRA